MDEVDGMAGSEDRAGVAELIALVRSTSVPLICICNDRQAPKLRSLAGHCFDLRFHRPQLAQIKGAMMSVAFKEKIGVTGAQLEQIVEASGHDIRQVLNRLSLLQNAAGGDDQTAPLPMAKKDTTANIFETVRSLFADEHPTRWSWDEKCALFFSDYNLMPLFAFENYVNVEPTSAGKKSARLDLLAAASDLMATGDVVDKQIRTLANWSLLNAQAIFGVVGPAALLRGHLKGMTQFPQWFGKNSRQGKQSRLLSQLQMHTSLKTSCNPGSFNLDYAPVLRSKLLNLLLCNQTEGGVEGVLALLAHYDLTRDDLDTVLGLTQWPCSKHGMANVAPRVKAALTRAYNKSRHALPFSTQADLTTSRRGGKKSAAAKTKVSANIDDEGQSDASADEEAQIGDYEDLL